MVIFNNNSNKKKSERRTPQREFMKMYSVYKTIEKKKEKTLSQEFETETSIS